MKNQCELSLHNHELGVQSSVAPMMDWTDNHYRTLARLMSKHAWLYTEMVVADTIIHQQDNLVSFALSSSSFALHGFLTSWTRSTHELKPLHYFIPYEVYYLHFIVCLWVCQDKFLKFNEVQHPIVLQLGGSDPEKLLKASLLASVYEYDEINLK